MKMIGYVVSWNDSKGYGFIRYGSEQNELFAHYADIKNSKFQMLTEGERVKFELHYGAKGLVAKNIERLGYEHQAQTVS